MGYFDFLIDKSNQAPKPNQKYLYNLDMVWRPGELEYISVPQAKLIATNVQRKDNGSFIFNLEGMEGEYRTNYGWALVEMTDENMKQFEVYRKASRVADGAERLANAERAKVKTLALRGA